ncbi:acyclic terpene utilization AtuA family protein [Nocardia goodfellowii]
MSLRRAVRVASFSGGMGDRFTAFRESVHGSPVDAVIGDSMTEFVESMVTAHFFVEPEKHRSFFSPLFVTQLLPELGAVAEKKLKVVTNAGVHAPKSLAGLLRKAIRVGGLDLRVAYVTGDDLYPEIEKLVSEGQLVNDDTGQAFDNPQRALSADAYLGAWGVKAALDAGADIVITGRVADASLVSGVAAWWHGWERDELNKIAGAIAAGHVIECGAHATGGNFSGFTTVPENIVLGFPIAEIAENGDSVITKRPGEGGIVTVDTVTAQLLYEIQGPRYLNPDVTWHTDSVTVTQEGPDRVRISGAQGSAPSDTTRVGIHLHTGYRGSMWYFPTGVQIEEKVDVLRRQAEIAAKENQVAELRFFVCGREVEDPADQWQATVPVQVVAAADTAEHVESFLAQLNSYLLGSFPGFYIEVTRMFDTSAQARIDYWPGLVRQDSLRHQVHLSKRKVVNIPPPPITWPFPGQPTGTRTPLIDLASFGPVERRALGDVLHVRVGDKAANANLGAWVRDDAAYPWLLSFLTAARVTELLALPPTVTVDRYEFPKLRGLCFVLRNYLAPSSSGGLSLDQLGKSLGEFLRARHADIPVSVLPGRG